VHELAERDGQRGDARQPIAQRAECGAALRQHHEKAVESLQQVAVRCDIGLEQLESQVDEDGRLEQRYKFVNL
jgi:hypothetical protein